MAIRGLFILTVYLMSSQALSGGFVVGNGGNVLSCQNPSNPYHSMPLDYYELNHRYGFEHQFDHSATYEQRLFTVDILDKIYSLNPTFAFYLLFEIFEFEISADVKNTLPFSNDIKTTLPKGCSLKTVILQLQQDPPLYHVTTEYKNLPDLYQLILKFHEGIYNLALNQNPDLKSSDHVRKLTAYLFSKEFHTATDSAYLNELIYKIQF